jgi:methylenetetrahydrofolate dehydrogenase (NADP+) / methenyltetrahydrofolate cyclohydrolase
MYLRDFVKPERNMTAKIINGEAVAESIRAQVALDVAARLKDGKSCPKLATVLVGSNPGSIAYIRMKHKACQQVGIDSIGIELPEDARQEDVEKVVQDLNADPTVNGILVQVPLPSGLNEELVLNAIRIEKDVDGFHPLNIGRLAQKGRDPLFISCTPAGIMILIEKEIPDLSGVHAVVLGRSNIVGLPVALLLLRANATVTICHSRTVDLPSVTRQADVLVAAVGKPHFVRADWVKPGAVVIDAGTSRVEDATRKKGYRLDGDVAFDEVKEVAGAITPVPGGVGPMTIALLLQNTLRAANLSDK